MHRFNGQLNGVACCDLDFPSVLLFTFSAFPFGAFPAIQCFDCVGLATGRASACKKTRVDLLVIMI